jgi:hypothetical protein
MIRQLVIFVLFLFGAFFAGIYLAYGSIDPCRALASEEARRSVLPTAVAEVFNRVGNGGMNRLQCSRGLFESWQERLMS